MNLSTDPASVVDLVIGITLIEFGALALYWRCRGRGVALRDFAANMISGLCLMAALRCAVASADTAWIGLWLLAAGLAHASDIVARWRSGGPRTIADERMVA